MMPVFIFTATVGISLLVCSLMSRGCGKDLVVFGLVFGAIYIFASGVVAGRLFSSEPTALDVYRHKTVMKINCEVINKDTVVIDSTVVFRKQE